MPPKKAHKAESAPSPAQQKKDEAKAAKALEEATIESERLETIQHDKLIVRHSDATPALTVSDIFNTVMKQKQFEARPPATGTHPFDWSIFRAELEKRTPESPMWFVQIRTEDLVLEPKGLDGVHVEVAIVVEAKEPSLAPMHMVYREARPYSDLEDNTPERIIKLEELDLCWREVRSDAGTAINVFLLQKSPNKTLSKTASNISFGLAPLGATVSTASTTPTPATAAAPPPASAPPAPAGFGAAKPAGFGGAAPQAPPAGFGGAAPKPVFAGVTPTGFGAGAPAAAAGLAKTPSFGFGSTAPAPVPAANTASRPMFEGRPVSPQPAEVPKAGLPANAAPQFGAAKVPSFGAAVAAPKAPAGPPAGFGGKSAAPAKNTIDAASASFTLWTVARLNEMRKEIKGGSRIVVEGFKLPPPVDKTIKLQLQNENEKIAEVADAVARTQFARSNKDLVKLDAWINDCPIYDEKFQDALSKMRARQIAEAIEDAGPAFEAIAKVVKPAVTAKLEELVAERKKMLDEEVAVVDEILQLVKKRVLLPKDNFRIFKYYPANNILPFRPFGKVTGVHEAGESADVCVPPAYVAQNTFARKP